MTLSEKVRDELAMMSTALTAALTATVTMGKPPPNVPQLLARYGQLMEQAQNEFNASDQPVLSARPSKFVKDIEFPLIVCLCGSTRFWKTFQEQSLRETLDGKVVLSIGSATSSDVEHGITDEQKVELDALHLRKLDLADECLILNCDGYIGPSTQQELAYALAKNKRVRFLEPERGQVYLTLHQQELQDLGRRC